jgi:hypothetical protein
MVVVCLYGAPLVGRDSIGSDQPHVIPCLCMHQIISSTSPQSAQYFCMASLSLYCLDKASEEPHLVILPHQYMPTICLLEFHPIVIAAI